MTFVLGLTGSIGMGKSTTAGLFLDMGCDVWDADAAVHRLYAKGGAAVADIRRVFPEAIDNDSVDRDRLKAIIQRDETALGRIEAIVHPLVARDREEFLASSTADIVVLDIPLLFENGIQDMMHAVAVVSADPALQRARVMARPSMTEARFRYLLSQQIPDSEKRKKADFIIVTDTIDHARQQVEAIISDIRKGSGNA